MKKIIAAIIALSATPALASADGFTFGKAEFDRPDVEVQFVVLRSQQELQAEAERLGAWVDDDRRIRAFSLIQKNSNKCVIYMLTPDRNYQPEYIGHELMHCKYGRWHK